MPLDYHVVGNACRIGVPPIVTHWWRLVALLNFYVVFRSRMRKQWRTLGFPRLGTKSVWVPPPSLFVAAQVRRMSWE